MPNLVLKVGGSLLGDSRFLERLGQFVAEQPTPPILVHGGATQAAELSARLGLEPRFEDGLRVIDSEALEVAVQSLAGAASVKLVQHLVQAGVSALGLTGADASLITVAPHPNLELGFVGVPTEVSPRLSQLVEAGFVPCVAALGLDEFFAVRQVDSDSLAATIAAALKPSRLIFLSNSPVLVGGVPLQRLTPTVSERLLSEGLIDAGMAVKVKAAEWAVAAGVDEVIITDLGGLENKTGTLVG